MKNFANSTQRRGDKGKPNRDLALGAPER